MQQSEWRTWPGYHGVLSFTRHSYPRKPAPFIGVFCFASFFGARMVLLCCCLPTPLNMRGLPTSIKDLVQPSQINQSSTHEATSNISSIPRYRTLSLSSFLYCALSKSREKKIKLSFFYFSSLCSSFYSKNGFQTSCAEHRFQAIDVGR